MRTRPRQGPRPLWSFWRAIVPRHTPPSPPLHRARHREDVVVPEGPVGSHREDAIRCDGYAAVARDERPEAPGPDIPNGFGEAGCTS